MVFNLNLFNWPGFTTRLLFLCCNASEVVGKIIYLGMYMYTYVNLLSPWP